MTVTDTAPREKFASFPSGSLRYGGEEFHAIGKSHGGGWDVDQVADAYRQHMGDRLHRLSGAKLEQSWKGWCESYSARRGRPSVIIAGLQFLQRPVARKGNCSPAILTVRR